MDERSFPESVQYHAVMVNLEKNGGQLKCENCKKKVISKAECHFDHITPFSKGGKSVLSNCQILCVDCNLEKNDKQMHDFVLEAKAKRFLFGDGVLEDSDYQVGTERRQINQSRGKLPKEEVEKILRDFVAKNGIIRKIDFEREKNNLPSFSLVNLYWGNIRQMQKELGFPINIPEWNRESIKLTVEKFIQAKGDIIQTDFKSRNGLPSIPCVLAYYPELHNFSEIKEFFGLRRTVQSWNYELAVQAGKTFVVQAHGKLIQKDLRKRNNLPGMKVIERLFGSLQEYQKAIGAAETQRNELISVEELDNAVIEYFRDEGRVVTNRKEFFRNFRYSQSTVIKRFESVDAFFSKYGISESNPKKFKYTKNEVDNLIIEFIKAGNKIPKTAKGLTKINMPSSNVILRYYDTWREPFIYFQTLYEKIH